MWDILACSLLPVPIKKPVWLMCHYNHWVIFSNLQNFRVVADQLNMETKILATTSKRYSGNICGYLSKYKAKGAKSLRQQRIFANIFCLFMNDLFVYEWIKFLLPYGKKTSKWRKMHLIPTKICEKLELVHINIAMKR